MASTAVISPASIHPQSSCFGSYPHTTSIMDYPPADSRRHSDSTSGESGPATDPAAARCQSLPSISEVLNYPTMLPPPSRPYSQGQSEGRPPPPPPLKIEQQTYGTRPDSSFSPYTSQPTTPLYPLPGPPLHSDQPQAQPYSHVLPPQIPQHNQPQHPPPPPSPHSLPPPAHQPPPPMHSSLHPPPHANADTTQLPTQPHHYSSPQSSPYSRQAPEFGERRQTNHEPASPYKPNGMALQPPRQQQEYPMQPQSVEGGFSPPTHETNGSSIFDMWKYHESLHQAFMAARTTFHFTESYWRAAAERREDQVPSDREIGLVLGNLDHLRQSLLNVRDFLQHTGIPRDKAKNGDKSSIYRAGPGHVYPGVKKRRGRAAPPGRCHSCNRIDTPEWRRGPDGARTLCNACGLHYAKLERKRLSEMRGRKPEDKE